MRLSAARSLARARREVCRFRTIGSIFFLRTGNEVFHLKAEQNIPLSKRYIISHGKMHVRRRSINREGFLCKFNSDGIECQRQFGLYRLIQQPLLAQDYLTKKRNCARMFLRHRAENPRRYTGIFPDSVSDLIGERCARAEIFRTLGRILSDFAPGFQQQQAFGREGIARYSRIRRTILVS